MPWPELLRDHQILGLLVGLAVIIVGGSITIVKLWIRHRERMAMIEQGLDPDAGHVSIKAEAMER